MSLQVCRTVIFLLFTAAIGMPSLAQDTVFISQDKVNTKVLKPGVHRYLVYFKAGKDSSRSKYQFWTRTIDLVSYQGRDAISVKQEWEDNDTIIHKVYSVCDRKTFQPLYHESWWRSRGGSISSFDFIEKKASFQRTPLTDADTAAARRNMYGAFKKSLDQYVLNWHLDLEVFPILPYKQGTTFMINFYDPGFSAPKHQPYTVAGSGTLTGYDNQQIDCWLLTHSSAPGYNETFWISKKTREVLKLEQEFNGKWRYKIKMGYSI